MYIVADLFTMTVLSHFIKYFRLHVLMVVVLGEGGSVGVAWL